MAVLGVVSAVGMVVDDRVLVGSPIWFKPLKFSVSFALYGLTLTWMLGRRSTASRTGWWAGTVITVAGVIEMAVLIGQTLRGRRSHFNAETPLDQALFQIMGVTIVVLWLGTLVIAVLLFRDRDTDRATAWAIRLGAVIALVGLGLGALMLGPTPDQQAALARGASEAVGAHSVGVPDGGPSMPLTGWSTTGGDLRIPHFVGMHALQLLPLLVMVLTALATRFARLADDRVRLRLVLLASGVYAASFALVLWQALRGQPLIHPDGVTLGTAGLILLAAVCGTYGSLRATTPSSRKATDVADTGAPKELVS